MPSALPLDTELLPETMRNCGYHTMAAGKWHLGYAKTANTPWGRGFHNFTGYLGGSEDYYKKTRCLGHTCGIDQNTDGEIFGERVYDADASEYSAFKYIRQAKNYIDGRDKDKPFFLYLPMQSVHAPLEAPAEYIAKYDGIIEDKPRKIYAGMVSVMDEGIGNITSHLKESGRAAHSGFRISENSGRARKNPSRLGFRSGRPDSGFWATFGFSGNFGSGRNSEKTESARVSVGQTRFGLSGNFRVFGQFRVGWEFGRATQKFLVSDWASVGKSENSCPNEQP